jgi:hypothetical protein
MNEYKKITGQNIDTKRRKETNVNTRYNGTIQA